MQDSPCQFNIQPIDGNCSQNPGGEYRKQTFSVQVPDKHDGVVNIHSALWNSNDSFDDLNNIYMSDVELNENGLDEGGYNHFELRNYVRQYELEVNNQPVFKIGDPNPAMERVEDWLDDRFN